jgi:hypothetical protein
MAYTDPLLALGDALYGVLALDTTLEGLAPGGVFFDVPQITQATVFPFIWLDLRHDENFHGFGAQPGRKSRPQVQLRVHVYQSDYGTARDAELVMARIVDLLWNDAEALVVSGYLVYCNGKPMPQAEEFQFNDEELLGIKVKEFVLQTNYLLEEAA